MARSSLCLLNSRYLCQCEDNEIYIVKLFYQQRDKCKIQSSDDTEVLNMEKPKASWLTTNKTVRHVLLIFLRNFTAVRHTIITFQRKITNFKMVIQLSWIILGRVMKSEKK